MLSVILPTYNERENLSHYIPRILKSLESKSSKEQDFEILIVDDNSPDKTWELAESLTLSDHRIRCFRRIGERGLSSAVLFGACHAKGDWILIMDADGQHDETIIPAMLGVAQSKSADLVVGSRLVGEGNYGKISLLRRMISHTADRVGKWILNVPIQDAMSGFFLIKRELLTKNMEILNPKGFKILLEIVCRIPQLVIIEVPYQFRERVHGKTKLSSKVAIDYILSLLEIRYRIRFSPYFVKYSIVGSMGIFVNIFFQYFFERIIQTGLYNSISPIASGDTDNFIQPGMAVIFGFEMSLLHNFIWNQNWTFSDKREKWYTAILKFHFVSIFGFLIQLSVWFYFYSLFLERDIFPSQATYVSNLIGILFAFISNYILNRNLTWRRDPT